MNVLLMLLGLVVAVEGFANLFFFHFKRMTYIGRLEKYFQAGRFARAIVGIIAVLLGYVGL